jgi:hypothetical protein
MRKIVAAVAASMLVSSPLLAEQHVNFQPIENEGATIRYTQGVATVDIEHAHGAVQVTPLGVDHGRLTFQVVALNLGDVADNFGVEDVHASIGDQDVATLTRERLDQMARHRAFWSQVAVAAITGAAAGIAASQRDHYSATTFTPHGTYRTFISAPSTGGQVAAAGLTAGGAYSIAQIQNQLDATREGLAEEILQTTTIDPRDSYGGRIVIEKRTGRNSGWPQDVHLTVHFGDEDYVFAFHVTRG